MGIKYFVQANQRVLTIAAVIVAIGLTSIIATTITPATASNGCTSTLLKRGVRGGCVRDLQIRLNNAGFSAGAVDGSFGTKTRSGVIAYQRYNNLKVDGVVGKETWKSLTKQSSTRKNTARTSTTTAPANTLRSGAKGSQVRNLQDRLARAGFAVGRAGADGSYGTGTSAAVKKFQRAHGLKATGIADNATQKKLKNNPTAPDSVTAHLDNTKARSGTNIVADKSDRTVYVFKNGVLQRAITARFGGEGSYRGVAYSKTTPTSATYVSAKIKNGYSERYTAAMPYFTVFNGHIGFHYSGDFARTGYGANGKRGSNGCVNIGNKSDAKYIFDQSTTGSTRVVVQN